MVKDGTAAEIAAGVPYSGNLPGTFAAVNSGGNALYWIKSDGTLSADLLSAATSVTDTATIDLTLSGGALSGAVKISNASGNIVTSDANGIYVKDLTVTGPAGVTYNSGTRTLTISNLLVTDVSVRPVGETTLAAFITAAYTAGTEFQEGDVIILPGANPVETWIHNGGTAGTSADFTKISSLGMNSFTTAGDTGSTSITNGGTLTIAGGTGLSSVVSGNTLTLNLDNTGLAALGTAPDSADTFVMYDASASTFKTATFSNLQTGVLNSVAFAVAGNSGPNQTISNGNTLTIAGGGGLTAVASNTDTITVGFSNAPTTNGTTKQVYVFNDDGDTYSWVNIASLEANFFTENLTQTSNRAHSQGTNTVTIDGSGSWTFGSATAGASRVNISGGDLEFMTDDKGIVFKVGAEKWRLKMLAGGILTTESIA